MRILGKENTTEVIEEDNDKVWKLFYEGYTYSAIEREYNNSKLIKTMYIPMPEVYKFLILNYIDNKFKRWIENGNCKY